MFLNANVPEFECFVREEFLYAMDRERVGSFREAVAFGIASVKGQAIGFHVLLRDGAQFARLPVHALAHEKGRPTYTLAELQPWDAFSAEVGVIAYDFLKGSSCEALMRRAMVSATYRFTIDWTGSASADGAGDLGHKCAHLLALANGQYALLPNNRILWHSPAFTEVGAVPDYERASRVWIAEQRKTEFGG